MAQSSYYSSRNAGDSSEITGENLEDLLAFDDLFLDYFNSFLSLPVFPQALMYNRLTGAFDKVDCLSRESTTSLSSHSPLFQYGPTDAERENMLEWAQQERLPIFLRTQLFRELKLLKSLLRPLADHQSASHGSSCNIRGYSRATESYISSLSVSGDNSVTDIYDEDIWGDPHYSALYRYQRPGSRSLSLPTMVLVEYGATRSSKHSSLKALSATTSERSLSGVMPQFSESHKKYTTFSQTEQNKESLPNSGKMNNLTKQRTRISTKVEVIPREANYGQRVSTGVGSNRRSSSRSRAPTSSTEDAFLRGARVLSAPINYEQFIKRPKYNISGFDALFGNTEAMFGGQTLVQFDMEGISEEQTETDIRNMEGRLKMTVQQVKERILGSRSGFEQFREFLQGTTGEHLLAFWLECENFRDTLEDFDESEAMKIENAYFRNVQDKFKLKLTADAVEQINKAANNMELSHTIFLRTQYDVLRRLRAYWVPRFLIHWEMSKTINSEDGYDDNRVPSVLPILPPKKGALVSSVIIPPGKNYLPFFPSISLVRSVPLLPEDIKDYTNHLLMEVKSSSDNVTVRKMLPDQQSLLSARSRKSSSSVTVPCKERFLLALSADKLAGGPFKRYLARQDDPALLARLMFWEDVTEYGVTEADSSDRLLRLCHAWNIYNKYLSEDCAYNIGLPEKERNRLQTSLKKARDFIEASIFDCSKIQAMEKLEKAWVKYLKEDLKKFLDCRAQSGDESPLSTAEVMEITLTEHDVIIKRPMPWVRRVPGSTATERARRLNKALLLAEEMDDEKRAQKKLEAATRRKEMERKRKRAIRAANAKQKEGKWKKQSLHVTEFDKLDDELPERETLRTANRFPVYQNLAGNKQVMTMFRKYINEGENKELLNKLQLLSDIDTCVNLKDNKAKKTKASSISKLYLEPQGKRYTKLDNENLIALIAEEKDQINPAVLQEIQKTVLPEIEEIFQDFVLRKADELNVDPRDLVSMSQSELAKCQENEQAGGNNKRKSRGKTTGRAQATREDKNEFLAALNQCAMGHVTMPVLYFYKYLLKYGENDGMPLIDKDLFFYIEVQKFKDGSHNFADEELLKKKIQSIVECFLESVYSPELQIDIPTELHQKTLKAAQRYLSGKEVTSTLFDEAQFHVFKELLFYWAGFMKSLSVSEDLRKRPVNKYDKMLQRRMERIQNYKTPSSDFILPSVPEGAVPFFNISLSEGVKLKEQGESLSGTPVSGRSQKQQHKTSILGSDSQGKQSREPSRRESLVAR